jgi:glyceraldehyde 3-phosphate dehydrogenase
MFIGINGFGRIGKCVFLQLLDNPQLHVSVINAPDFDINKIEYYLKHDSVHHYNKLFQVEIIDNDSFTVNGFKTHIFRNRDATKLKWREYGITHIIDATGAFLTEETAKRHNAEYIIMSAPAKDNTPLYIHGVNLDSYNGAKIVSCASCTTNSIAPVLRHLNEKYGIQNANFITIHASTASQKVVDTAHSKNRTDRSIFNNIIPHTTGASSSIFKVLPELSGKIVGTSVRVPTNNVSLIDLNVELDVSTDMETILENMRKDDVLQIVSNNFVSSDFISTECPSIIDMKASMYLGGNRFKIAIWYDNEWSYASQVIKLMTHMINYSEKDPSFIENHNFKDKQVVLRLDLNIPMKDGKITDDFRIKSAIQTIHRILKDKPQRIVIMSHLGRPKGYDPNYSLEPILSILESHIGTENTVRFLPDGISQKSMDSMEMGINGQIYLLENLRFHKEETDYTILDNNADNEVIQLIQNMGNVYVNDAFGCAHRNHLSITGIHCEERAYGYLIEKEMRELNTITQNNGSDKILAIIGGGKMDDKLELLKNLCKKVDTIYIAGGNINSLLKNNMTDYLSEIRSHKAKIVLMTDGLCASNLIDLPKHISTDLLDLNGSNGTFLDIGIESFSKLQQLISEHNIVFWNGTMGVVEDAKYKKGSDLLVHTLINESRMRPNKKIIVGGGDTAGFVNQYNHNFTHISTGGGAAIEYITHDTLVGLDVFKSS